MQDLKCDFGKTLQWSATGRNGAINQTGIFIESFKDDEIIILPINSRHNVSWSSYTTIPKDIRVLTEIRDHLDAIIKEEKAKKGILDVGSKVQEDK